MRTIWERLEDPLGLLWTCGCPEECLSDSEHLAKLRRRNEHPYDTAIREIQEAEDKRILELLTATACMDGAACEANPRIVPVPPSLQPHWDPVDVLKTRPPSQWQRLARLLS